MINKKLLCIAAMLCILLTGCLSAQTTPASDPAAAAGAVATVDGQPVFLGEYSGYAYDFIAQATGKFAAEYGADPNAATFWQTEYDGVTPLAWVKQQADSVMRTQKGTQALAVRLGLVEEINWAKQQDLFVKENLTRAEKAKNGEVVYGPIELTQSQFLSYWQSEVEQLVEDYVKYDEINPTELALAQYYNENKNELDSEHFSAELGFLFWPQGEQINDAAQLFEQLLAEELSGEELAEAFSQQTGVRASYREDIADTKEIGKENEPYERVIRLIRPTQAGQVAGELTLNGMQMLVWVKSKTNYEIGTFEENYQIIEDLYRTEKMKAYIAAQLEEMPIVMLPAYDEITIEDLRAAHA